MKKYLKLASMLVMPLVLCSCEKALDEATAAQRYQAMYDKKETDYPLTLKFTQTGSAKIKQGGVNIETTMNTSLNVDKDGHVMVTMAVNDTKIKLCTDDEQAYLDLKSGKNDLKVKVSLNSDLGPFDDMIQEAWKQWSSALTEATEMLNAFIANASAITPKAYADGRKCRFAFESDNVKFNFSTRDDLFCGYKIEADSGIAKFSIKVEIDEYDGKVTVKSPDSYTSVDDFGDITIPGFDFPGL